jgi:hypothetical protein
LAVGWEGDRSQNKEKGWRDNHSHSSAHRIFTSAVVSANVPTPFPID